MTKKKEKIKPETYEKRRNELFERMDDGVAIVPAGRKSRRADGLYHPFRPDMDFYYLTGIDEPNVVALFIKDGSSERFVLFLEPRDPKQETWEGAMIGLNQAKEAYGADEAHPIDELEDRLSTFIEGHRLVYFPIGRYEELDQSYKNALNTLRTNIRNRKRVPATTRDISDLIHPMRLTKTPEEIELHRRAIDLTWKGLMRAMKGSEPGRFEYELEAVLESEFRRRGGDGTAFQTIVAGGNNATVLHYQDNEDRLNNEQLVLVDSGASYQYHCADITRTFPVNGTFTPPQRAFYEEVLACQKNVIEQVEPGASYTELQEYTVELLTESMVKLGLLEGDLNKLRSTSDDSEQTDEKPPYKQFYMHKIGHWLGLDTHDVGPYRQFGTEDPAATTLEPGMLVTIEPGLYVPEHAENVPDEYRGLGVRIEDDILVTESGCEVLSQEIPRHPDELEEITG